MICGVQKVQHKSGTPPQASCLVTRASRELDTFPSHILSNGYTCDVRQGCNFRDLAGRVTVIAYLSGPWCGLCNMMRQVNEGCEDCRVFSMVL